MRWHEPPTFNGVERPSVEKLVIPTTWSSDAIGMFGRPVPAFSYEAYVMGGLDGSKFSSLNGIRDGRIKGRASLNDPAFARAGGPVPVGGRGPAAGPVPPGRAFRLRISWPVNHVN